MYGAILGDMIGAPYEFDRGGKTKDFPLFSHGSHFTDDTAMTIAVADALLEAGEAAERDGAAKDAGTGSAADDVIRKALVRSMHRWGERYPDAGYGGRFYGWLFSGSTEPYGSYGNGSAMRVSSAGWLYDTLEETRRVARLTADVTHNHPEGIRGAEAAASAIFLARCGSSKEEIKEYIIREFGYDLSRTCDEIRPFYHHVESCQKTVPEAITAFLEGTDFEDVIRTAVSLGGDCDTLTCIAGGIAEAFYGVPEEMKAECRKRLPKDMLEVLDRFEEKRRPGRTEAAPEDPFLEGNEMIEEAIRAYYAESTDETLRGVLEAVRERMHKDGHLLLPVVTNEDGTQFTFRTIQTNDGKQWLAAFTSHAEYEKGQPSRILSGFIDAAMKYCGEAKAPGIIINPWGQSFMLAADLIEMIFKADGGVEYTVPEDELTPELLEDGSFLKRAIEICSRNRTQMNLLKVLRILRDSVVWVPCNAIMSDADYARLENMVKGAGNNGENNAGNNGENNVGNNGENNAGDNGESGGPASLEGSTFTTEDQVRLVPDILQSGEEYFFPVFTSEEEMGEYGEHFSKVPNHFLNAVNLARNNEKNVKGIVINAFTGPFEVPRELFDLITEMPSALEQEE